MADNRSARFRDADLFVRPDGLRAYVAAYETIAVIEPGNDTVAAILTGGTPSMWR